MGRRGGTTVVDHVLWARAPRSTQHGICGSLLRGTGMGADAPHCDGDPQILQMLGCYVGAFFSALASLSPLDYFLTYISCVFFGDERRTTPACLAHGAACPFVPCACLAAQCRHG